MPHSKKGTAAWGRKMPRGLYPDDMQGNGVWPICCRPGWGRGAFEAAWTVLCRSGSGPPSSLLGKMVRYANYQRSQIIASNGGLVSASHLFSALLRSIGTGLSQGFRCEVANSVDAARPIATTGFFVRGDASPYINQASRIREKDKAPTASPAAMFSEATA